MGVHPAPDYANIYLARRIDKKIKALLQNYIQNEGQGMSLLLRFLDDIISLLYGTTKQQHTMLEEINNIHPTLKFTFAHTTPEGEAAEDRCDCPVQKSIPFLDTPWSIIEGRKDTDVFLFFLTRQKPVFIA